MNQQVFTYAQQFAENSFKVQSTLLKSLEQAAALQFKALEQQSDAFAALATEVLEVRDVESLRSLWEKSGELQRDQIERNITAAQDLMGLAQETAETLGAFARTAQPAARKPAAAKKAA